MLLKGIFFAAMFEAIAFFAVDIAIKLVGC
jgi:hypothetical protein